MFNYIKKKKISKTAEATGFPEVYFYGRDNNLVNKLYGFIMFSRSSYKKQSTVSRC